MTIVSRNPSLQAGPVGEPIPYMARTRDYYLTLGYGNPYQWAENAEIPFARLIKPLAKTRVALVTTAARFDPAHGDQGPTAPYNSAAKFYEVYSLDSTSSPDLRISHIAYDRTHTRPDDINAYFPLVALRRALAAGRIGEVTPRFHGFPTNRSQKTTVEVDAPALLARLAEDGAEAAIFVPNCPVCHQCVTLAARHVEAAGIPTVIMGAAHDIVTHAGPPRFLSSDVPLGNAAGRPHDVASQDLTLALALDLLEKAYHAGTIWTSPLRWAETDAWKRDFMDITRLSAEEIARSRAENDRQKAIAKEIREA